VQCDPQAPPTTYVDQVVCNDSALKVLDAEMASAVGAILSSPTAPRDFEAGQRAWMARRDQCSNIPCVGSQYQERLREIAAFVPSGGDSKHADDETTAETRRIAVEWGIPLLRGRLYLPQLRLQSLQSSLNPSPVMIAWTKVMVLTGVSVERDLSSQYNDNSLRFLGCKFLDKAAQEQLGGGKLCGNNTKFPIFVSIMPIGPPNQYAQSVFLPVTREKSLRRTISPSAS
jgi:uncharacterized protein